MYKIMWNGKEKFQHWLYDDTIRAFFNLLTFSGREFSERVAEETVIHLNNLAKSLGLDLTITRE